MDATFRVRADIVGLILGNRRLFSKNDLGGAYVQCILSARHFSQANNHYASIELLELAVQLGSRAAIPVNDLILEIAREYEALGEQAIAQQNLAALSFLSKSAGLFRKAGNVDKADRTMARVSELKGTFPLSEISTEIDLTNHIANCGEIASNVIKTRPSDLLKILSAGNGIVPSHQEAIRTARDLAENSPFLSMIPVSPIDDLANTIGSYTSDKERAEYQFWRAYDIEVKFDKIQLIRALLGAGFEAGVLTSEGIRRHLTDGSWLGQKLTRRLPNGKGYEYTWLELLLPSIDGFVSLAETARGLPSESGSLIPLIDSLTLKFEGMLRDICRLARWPTTRQRTKGEVAIDFEMGLPTLLEQPPVTELLGQDEVTFLRYLLDEKLGMALRHRVAHTRVSKEAYSLDTMCLLLVGVLRLGRFTVGDASEESANTSASPSHFTPT